MLTDEDGQKKRARKARLSKSASFIEQNKETMYLEELDLSEAMYVCSKAKAFTRITYDLHK